MEFSKKVQTAASTAMSQIAKNGCSSLPPPYHTPLPNILSVSILCVPWVE